MPVLDAMQVDPATVKLGNNATKDEFSRVLSWLKGTPSMTSFPIPYKKMSQANLTMPGCLEWCAKHGSW